MGGFELANRFRIQGRLQSTKIGFGSASEASWRHQFGIGGRHAQFCEAIKAGKADRLVCRQSSHAIGATCATVPPVASRKIGRQANHVAVRAMRFDEVAFVR